MSPLTLRILAINVVALALLGGGFFYLGEYQQNLVATQIAGLETQGQIFAAALGEGALDNRLDGAPQALAPGRAREMMRRLVEPTHIRAQLFDTQGAEIADSRSLDVSSETIRVEALPPPDENNVFVRFAHRFYSDVMARIAWSGDYAPYIESDAPSASDYPEVRRAYQGTIASAVQRTRDGGLVLSAAVPVQYYKHVLGVVMLSSGSDEIEQAVRVVRLSIVELFLLALAVTILLSMFLAGTIVRPLRQLAAAAERVRRGSNASPAIPDFATRHDEIGELSVALSEMTDTIRRRMNAIEHFAADVAHELKNPLTSLRSAVETALRVDDAEKQKQLLALVLEDAKRLDRLITDISDASRLDAEMARDEHAPVPLGSLLGALIAVYREAAGPDSPYIALDLPSGGDAALTTRGNEERLVRVFRNLLDNATSFSPPGGTITVRARRNGDMIRVAVEDDGPGIPEGKLGAIFDRFYSERPAGERFGTHSRLGLAISKQIVEAHEGTIRAENRYGRDNRLRGARFTVDLPAETEAGGRAQ